MARFAALNPDNNSKLWDEWKEQIRQLLEEANEDVFQGKLKIVENFKDHLIYQLNQPNLSLGEKIFACPSGNPRKLRFITMTGELKWKYWDFYPVDTISAQKIPVEKIVAGYFTLELVVRFALETYLAS